MAESASRSKKFIVVASATALGLGGAGVAFAYWTSTGEGVGEAQTAESVAFTITSEVAEGDISPGSDGQTIAFTVANPGTGSQNLALVTVTLAEADGTPWVPDGDCLIADYSATISTAPAYGEIAAGDDVTGVATVVLANTAVNQDDCQDQVVPLYFAAS